MLFLKLKITEQISSRVQTEIWTGSFSWVAWVSVLHDTGEWAEDMGELRPAKCFVKKHNLSWLNKKNKKKLSSLQIRNVV